MVNCGRNGKGLNKMELKSLYDLKRIYTCERCGKLFTKSQLRKHVERGYCIKKGVK